MFSVLTLFRASRPFRVLPMSLDLHVRRMFANGEPGAIYDPSDLATLSQYSDGTGVVADVGDPVGRVLDISGCGTHLMQSTESQRPRLARVPRSGVRNLFQQSEQFGHAYWTKTSSSIVPDAALAPDGTLTADKLIGAVGSVSSVCARSVTVTAGLHTFSVFARAAEFGSLRLTTNATGVYHECVFDLLHGTATATAAVTAGIENVGGGWYRCSVFMLAAAGSRAFQLRFTTTGDGSSGLYLWGAQLEAGPVATMYQRVGQIYDVYESGAEHSHGLWFDGVDDGLSAAGLDLSGTDRVTVVAAVRMLNLTSGGSASIGMLANFRGTGAASWSLQAPDTSTGRINFSSSGAPESVRSAVVTGLSAPRSAVLTGIGDIAAATVRMRIDGAPAAENLLAQGAGSYESGAMSIGRQADSAARYYSGCVFGLIIRGAASSDREIAFAERWAAKRAGVAL